MTLYDDSRSRLVQILFYKLPLIYLASFSLRFVFIFLRCGLCGRTCASFC
jgi:hypothetical protein